MKGSGYIAKDKDGHTITSIDGYRTYCIIVDCYSRYTWTFLTKTKIPPLDIIATFLKQQGKPDLPCKTIRTDKGGELWYSQAFRQVFLQAGYILEPTAAGAPSQNGLAERPNLTLSTMVRCLLHSAALGPEYWSFAVLHAVYLKNRLPHSAMGATPYLLYTGSRPSAKELRIFGSHIISKQPGKRPTKLDSHTCTGRFLGYTATDKNIYYRDNQTHRIKITTYCTFDEGGMTVPPAEQPPSAKALQLHGYSEKPLPDTTDLDVEPPKPHKLELNINLLSDQAQPPARGTAESAGYDLFSPIELTIPLAHRVLIPLDIAATPPPGTYLQIAPRSGLSAKHNIDTKAGVIDADYTGNITVVLHNSSNKEYHIRRGDRIAQLLVLPIHHPTITITTQLPGTTRGTNGFGSTGPSAIIRSKEAQEESPKSPSQLPSALPDMPFDIYLSLDPFDNILQIEIPVKGGHPTLGLHLTECPYRHRLRLLDMTAGTPGSRIPKWRSALRNTYLLTIQDTNIGNLEECLQAIQHARKFGIIKLKCTFAVDKSYGIHPHEGIPQLYFDQLNTIAQHLQAIKPTVRQCQAPRHTNPAPQEPTAQSFTLKQLKLRDDWPEWQQSRYEMFDQYQAQGMFSDPMPLPLDSNALRMLWTFQLKLDGTKKSRMVCHMSSRIRNTITLGHTYANSLESTSERLFWAIVAQEDLVVVGTDVSNAFAEAPPPQAPL